MNRHERRAREKEQARRARVREKESVLRKGNYFVHHDGHVTQSFGEAMVYTALPKLHRAGHQWTGELERTNATLAFMIAHESCEYVIQVLRKHHMVDNEKLLERIGTFVMMVGTRDQVAFWVTDLGAPDVAEMLTSDTSRVPAVAFYETKLELHWLTPTEKA